MYIYVIFNPNQQSKVLKVINSFSNGVKFVFFLTEQILGNTSIEIILPYCGAHKSTQWLRPYWMGFSLMLQWFLYRKYQLASERICKEKCTNIYNTKVKTEKQYSHFCKLIGVPLPIDYLQYENTIRRQLQTSNTWT